MRCRPRIYLTTLQTLQASSRRFPLVGWYYPAGDTMWADRLSLVATGRTGGSTFSKYLTPLPLVVLPLLGRYAVGNLMFTVVTDCCAGKRATPNEKARLRIV